MVPLDQLCRGPSHRPLPQQHWTNCNAWARKIKGGQVRGGSNSDGDLLTAADQPNRNHPVVALPAKNLAFLGSSDIPTGGEKDYFRCSDCPAIAHL